VEGVGTGAPIVAILVKFVCVGYVSCNTPIMVKFGTEEYTVGVRYLALISEWDAVAIGATYVSSKFVKK